MTLTKPANPPCTDRTADAGCSPSLHTGSGTGGAQSAAVEQSTTQNSPNIEVLQRHSQQIGGVTVNFTVGRIAPKRPHRVLIGFEYSATVRDAFRARGFDAWSCDLLPTEGEPRWHMQGDIVEAIKSGGWDAIILHTPCNAMAVCGNSTYGAGKPKHHERLAALEWTEGVVRLALAHSPAVAVENGASVLFPMLRERLNADVQYIHPWQHGHPEQKKTGFALWGLPRLKPSNVVYDAMMELPRHERERIHFMSPGPDRAKERARFFPGVAAALADQWGGYLIQVSRQSRKPGGGSPPSDTGQHFTPAEGGKHGTDARRLNAVADPSPTCGGVCPCDGPAAVFLSNHDFTNTDERQHDHA